MPKTIAFLIQTDICADDYLSISQALSAAGHRLCHLSACPQTTSYKLQNSHIKIDAHLHEVKLATLDGLLLFRDNQHPQVHGFVQSIANAYKPIFSLSCATPILVAAQVAHGRRLTADPQYQDILQAAHAVYLNQAVVNDHNLYISQQSPTALAEFLHTMLKVLHTA
ncbi:DJ-1/PfpI family protein [uncultured Acinetobacter sp.]|uniref:DJ-1/PfpI family protein n=1 Tax=uncultured Acinetobacter sp. TaxID=165433 RepID=UPI00261490FB|nr:DJ-1/PfpI family protein [uncultured Acinetobacter sp.]